MVLSQITHPLGVEVPCLYDESEDVIAIAKIIALVRGDFSIPNVVPISQEVLAARMILEYLEKKQTGAASAKTEMKAEGELMPAEWYGEWDDEGQAELSKAEQQVIELKAQLDALRKPDPKDVELVRHVMEEGWYFAGIRPLPFEKARFDSLQEKYKLAEAAFNRIVGNP